jgi:hypothetical protein
MLGLGDSKGHIKHLVFVGSWDIHHMDNYHGSFDEEAVAERMLCSTTVFQ